MASRANCPIIEKSNNHLSINGLFIFLRSLKIFVFNSYLINHKSILLM